EKYFRRPPQPQSPHPARELLSARARSIAAFRRERLIPEALAALRRKASSKFVCTPAFFWSFSFRSFAQPCSSVLIVSVQILGIVALSVPTIIVALSNYSADLNNSEKNNRPGYTAASDKHIKERDEAA